MSNNNIASSPPPQIRRRFPSPLIAQSYPESGTSPYADLSPIDEMAGLPSPIDGAESVHHVSSTADSSQGHSVSTSE